MEIQIISGFLGAGKTTFLNKYLPLLDGKIAVIENEFGDIGLDGELIESDVPIQELYAGCICCSLAMDFREGIQELERKYHPDKILIEPSGVGRLSDIIKACERSRKKDNLQIKITKLISIIDIASYEDYRENFGEFYLDQIHHAKLLLLSNLDSVGEMEKKRLITKIRELNSSAIIYEQDWRDLEGEDLRLLVQEATDYEEEHEVAVRPALPAGKVFSSFYVLTPRAMELVELQRVLQEIQTQKYGHVLRVKGRIRTDTGNMIKVDMTPHYSRCLEVEEKESKLIFIGCNMAVEALEQLFAGGKEKED